VKVGIIGYGRLGKLITQYLGQDSDCLIYDANQELLSDVDPKLATPASLAEVCKCPIIIPSVPISIFEHVIKEIAPLVEKNALIIDVCSVKEHPIEIMLEHLPPEVSILGTHPMFGPDSAKETLYGRKIVLCKTRIDDKLYSNLKAYLVSHGIRVIETSAAEHDEQISHSLVLSHLIGRSLIDIDATHQEIDTKGYRRLMKILDQVENDSWQLFEDMNRYNKFAKKVRNGFSESIKGILSKLDQLD
jgi:prephenate dehydrogenase